MGGDPKTVMLLLKANADPTLPNKVRDRGIKVHNNMMIQNCVYGEEFGNSCCVSMELSRHL